MRTFAQRLGDKSEAGQAHNRRVVALRKLLYDCNEILTGSIPALCAAWDYGDEEDDFLYDSPPAWVDDDLGE